MNHLISKQTTTHLVNSVLVAVLSAAAVHFLKLALRADERGRVGERLVTLLCGRPAIDAPADEGLLALGALEAGEHPHGLRQDFFTLRRVGGV